MSRALRRFEVLLPLRLNDGTPVPDDSVADTLIELEERFGAVSCETQAIRGHWRFEGQPFRDDLIRGFVDVPDDPRVAGSSSNSRSGSRPASSNSTSG